MPWSLSPFQLLEVGTTDSSRHLFFPTLHHADGAMLLVGFHLFGTSDKVTLPEALTVRLFCHALVQRLPEKGLREALESLTEMVQFYSEPESAQQLPEPGGMVPVRLTRTVDAPVFPVTEE